MDDLIVLQKLKKVKLHIFQIHSFEKMSSFISEKLAELCEVDRASIQKNQKTKRKGVTAVSLSSLPSYSLCFFKTSFSKTEKKFLKHIGAAINENLKKIEKQNQLQILKEQWKSAFNAIAKPICLTDKNFNILSTNEAFLEKTKQSKFYLHGKNCFSVFFGSELETFEIKYLLNSKMLKSMPDNSSVFEIHCQTFFQEPKEEALRLIILTDRTKQIEMEKKISQLADSAEMGIIAGSIAHELNNPLSGIQALLQLESDSKFKNQVDEMMEALNRCQNIIQQLLKSVSQNYTEDLPLSETTL